jgi:hypothetical protein
MDGMYGKNFAKLRLVTYHWRIQAKRAQRGHPY